MSNANMIKLKAFSLIEILIVTFIVTTAFMGIMALVKQTIVVRLASRDSFLSRVVAQEGIELVRYLRNENWQANKDFAYSLSNDSDHTDGTSAMFLLDKNIKIGDIYSNRQNIVVWYKNSDTFGFTPSENTNDYVKDKKTLVYLCEIENNNFYYSQAGTTDSINLVLPQAGCTPTKFHRVIETTYRDNSTANNAEDDSLEVRSIVYWNERGSDKYFILNTLLTDYAQKY